MRRISREGNKYFKEDETLKEIYDSCLDTKEVKIFKFEVDGKECFTYGTIDSNHHIISLPDKKDITDVYNKNEGTVVGYIYLYKL